MFKPGNKTPKRPRCGKFRLNETYFYNNVRIPIIVADSKPTKEHYQNGTKRQKTVSTIRKEKFTAALIMRYFTLSRGL